MAASWPSKREAAVTIRTLCFGLYGKICFIDNFFPILSYKFKEYSKNCAIRF
jgi:hypothetical protein